MKRKDFLQTLFPAALGSFFVPAAFGRPDPTVIAGQKMPAYLQAGDTIAITCPAGAMTYDDLRKCLETLSKWGFNTKAGNTIEKHWQRFGGTDEERAADFQQLLDDDQVKAIMFGRGGYGVMRMMDRINWEKFARNPKWLIGFSDITAFHCHVQAVLGIPTIHADMANGFNGTDDNSAISLRNILCGKHPVYRIDSMPLNRCGNAKGTLVGGNLSLVMAMQGSRSALQTKGKILFLEDVSEYKYTIDRMLINLKRSGMLDNLAGLIFGGFTAVKADTEESFPMSVEEIIYEKIKDYDYPVCFHFPAGHQKQNLALKLGCTYNLQVTKERTLLFEAEAASRPLVADLPFTDSLRNMMLDSSKALKDSI